MTIGDRILEIRQDQGMNQMDFAERLGTSRSHISNLEKNRKNLSQTLLRLICIEFYVDEEWLLTGEGVKYNKALNDVVDLMDSARGLNPSDLLGNEKAAAIELAAKLASVYEGVSLSCADVQDFLGYVSIPAVAGIINAVILALKSFEENPNPFRIFEMMANQYMNDDRINDRKKEQRENMRKFHLDSDMRYLMSLHEENERDS